MVTKDESPPIENDKKKHKTRMPADDDFSRKIDSWNPQEGTGDL
jgi:hypothetical protein